MNRWHRLAPCFRKLPSIEAAIELSITGLDPPIDGLDFPNIRERFDRYEDWLACDDCLPIRFEDLASENRDAIIRQMVHFYVQHCTGNCDTDTCVERMIAGIAPRKSHTFRSGRKSGWKKEFTTDHRRLFADVAGDLLVRLGYERDLSWVDPSPSARDTRSNA
jgi:hypothetical protein